MLWQYATEPDNPREKGVLAIVLADGRIASGSMRYCDYALGEFDRLTKERFDIAAAIISERDAAIFRAWRGSKHTDHFRRASTSLYQSALAIMSRF